MPGLGWRGFDLSGGVVLIDQDYVALDPSLKFELASQVRGSFIRPFKLKSVLNWNLEIT